jgi:hypothetical protein
VADVAEAAARAARLGHLADLHSGALDPPEPPPGALPARADFLRLTAVVPAAEAAKQRARGGRAHRIPFPGDERTAEEEELAAALAPGPPRPPPAAPGPLQGAQAPPPPALPAGLRARLAATVGDKQWEQARLRVKARAPHVVAVDTVSLTLPPRA